MLKPIKNYTMRWHVNKEGVDVQLNELPTELIDGIRRLDSAITSLLIVTSAKRLCLGFSPNYNPHDIWQAIDEILTAYYEPMPEAFTEFINGL